MTAFRQAILPCFLFLCIVVGGSAQAVWGNAFLQLFAIVLIGWSILTADPQPITRAGRRLLWIVAGLGLLILFQLVPLPPGIWTKLPDRQFVADGFSLLGMPAPWLPISLAPYDTLTTAMTLLPPLAMLVAMLRLKSWNAVLLFAAILAGTGVSILLGVLQVSSGDGSWYLYRLTNLGIAVGTFANGNHFANLLMISIPVLAALVANRLRAAENRQQRSLAYALGAAGAATILIGVLINNSTALLLLGPPVAAGSAMLLLRLRPKQLRNGGLAIVVMLGLATGALATFGDKLPGWGTSASIESRAKFWSKGLSAAKDELLTGSGIGTFEKVYQRYEDPNTVTRFYVNHAHNDYLEIAIESGVSGMALVMLLLAWWAGQSRLAWTEAAASAEQKAAVVASAAILLHSLFDFPLRTAAISTIMAACLALLAGARGTVKERHATGSRPARHATL